MLAITHHWIVQVASKAYLVGKWEERYEILGDDLTIFDPVLASAHLDIKVLVSVSDLF
jgi:hypothetical protein